jgi:hypothetical protein
LEPDDTPSILTAYRPRKYASFLGIGAFAGVGLLLLVPWLLGSTGATSGQAHVSGVDASSLSPSPVAGIPDGSLRVDGSAQIEALDNVIRLVVPVTAPGDRAIPLAEDAGEISVQTTTSDTSIAVFPGRYALTWLDGNNDHILDPGEHAVLTVDLPAAAAVRPSSPLTLVIKSSSGSRLVIENVLAK